MEELLALEEHQDDPALSEELFNVEIVMECNEAIDAWANRSYEEYISQTQQICIVSTVICCLFFFGLSATNLITFFSRIIKDVSARKQIRSLQV